MLSVFLSYSRRDREVAARLRDALAAAELETWIDVEGIAPASRWREELKQAIETADAFVFLISPHSAASVECAHELEYAEQLNKRIIPAHVRRTDPEALPEAVSTRQFIPESGLFEDDFDRSLATLLSAIETDLDWLKAHTAWGRKAIEWKEHDHDRSFLLSGSELDEAERWLAGQTGKQPAPTELQTNYVLRSRQRTTQRLRSTRAAISVALIVASALAIVALIERATAVANQKTAESRQLAADAEATLSSDPELSTLLSLRALAIRSTSQAEAALRDALPQLQVLGTLRPSAPLYSPSFSSNGKLVLTASADGAAEIWNASTGRRREVLSAASGTGSSRPPSVRTAVKSSPRATREPRGSGPSPPNASSVSSVNPHTPPATPASTAPCSVPTGSSS